MNYRVVNAINGGAEPQMFWLIDDQHIQGQVEIIEQRPQFGCRAKRRIGVEDDGDVEIAIGPLSSLCPRAKSHNP